MLTKGSIARALQHLGAAYIQKTWMRESDEWVVAVGYRGHEFTSRKRDETEAMLDVLKDVEQAASIDDTKPGQAYDRDGL